MAEALITGASGGANAAQPGATPIGSVVPEKWPLSQSQLESCSPMPEPPSICLTEAEIFALTGLQKPRCQVNVLQKRGFVRAYLRHGRALLERAHYEAVCRGQYAAPPEKRDNPPADRPRVRPVSRLMGKRVENGGTGGSG